jgi:hypothetical protein
MRGSALDVFGEDGFSMSLLSMSPPDIKQRPTT